MPRASGKTTLLIKESAKTGRPIIEPNTASARYVEEQARKMGVQIPEPISATSWNSGYYRGSNFNRIDGFLIDEVDSVLANIFGKPIDKATYTPKEMEYEKGGYFNMYFGETTNAYKSWVGYGSKIALDSSGIKISPSVQMSARLFIPSDSICDINVIVPDKVVEITFEDENKEKMVCHEDDTFDLRKCCFIAIAKHLYKKEYTQEGIEYMATQLTYQKKYVKIVDKALKDYKRKEEEKAEKIRREEEEKIIRARQSLKKRKQKERRAQRHREALIDVFADSINEAKARRKKDK